MSRDISLDLLRVASIAGVVMFHIVYPYNMNDTFNVLHLDSWIVDLIHFSLYWCVPIFFMISGALLLREHDESMRVFYAKRIKKVLIPTIFWSAFFLGYLFFFRDASLRDIAVRVLVGKPYIHLWFMYAIIGLYIFTPFIRMLLFSLNNEQKIVLLILLFVFSFGNGYLAFYLENRTTMFSVFLTYIGYYVLGHVLYENRDKFPQINRNAFLIFLAILVSTTLLRILINSYWRINLPVVSYFSPLVAAEAIALFLFPTNKMITVRSPSVWIQLSALSFGVYLIHPAFILLIKPGMTMENFSFFPLAYLFVLSASYAAVYFMSRVPYARNII